MKIYKYINKILNNTRTINNKFVFPIMKLKYNKYIYIYMPIYLCPFFIISRQSNPKIYYRETIKSIISLSRDSRDNDSL